MSISALSLLALALADAGAWAAVLDLHLDGAGDAPAAQRPCGALIGPPPALAPGEHQSAHLDVKVAAVALPADQRGKPHVGAEQVRGLAVFRGSQARARHAEGYEPMRFTGSGLGDS